VVSAWPLLHDHQDIGATVTSAALYPDVRHTRDRLQDLGDEALQRVVGVRVLDRLCDLEQQRINFSGQVIEVVGRRAWGGRRSALQPGEQLIEFVVGVDPPPAPLQLEAGGQRRMDDPIVTVEGLDAGRIDAEAVVEVRVRPAPKIGRRYARQSALAPSRDVDIHHIIPRRDAQQEVVVTGLLLGRETRPASRLHLARELP
jgi:hypothetical protein